MAELVITGRIIQKLPMQSGTSKAGNPWRKQEYVLETTDSNFPKQICFNFFGDRIDQNPLEIGDMVNVSIDLQSREWNGRWYTDVSAWKAEKTQPGGMSPDPLTPNSPMGSNQVLTPPDLSAGASDDLPF